VKVVSPSSGYYIFPDFNVIRTELADKNIHTGAQMCSAILKDINVAVSLLILCMFAVIILLLTQAKFILRSFENRFSSLKLKICVIMCFFLKIY